VRFIRAGISIPKIAEASGDSTAYVEMRRNLTQLAPPIQKLLNPELPSKQQLAVTMAGVLGGISVATVEEIEALHHRYAAEIADQKVEELKPYRFVRDFGDETLRFELQKILLAVIQYRKLNAARAIEFIRERSLDLKSSARRAENADRFTPRKRKLVIRNLAEVVIGNASADYDEAEFERIFASSNSEEVEPYRDAVSNAAARLTAIAKQLLRIKEQKQAAESKGSDVAVSA